jgi:hypothetical protein
MDIGNFVVPYNYYHVASLFKISSVNFLCHGSVNMPILLEFSHNMLWF